MKLYVWTNVPYLCDYTDGIAFALADTEEQAVALLAAGATSDSIYKITIPVGELSKGELNVYDSPVGIAIYGGG